MTTRRIVIGLGALLMLFGLWALLQAHTQVGVCNVSGPAGAGATSGVDSTCVKTLMAYLEGFVHPARYQALASSGKIPASLAAELPTAAEYAGTQFATLAQITKASALCVAKWDSMVGGV